MVAGARRPPWRLRRVLRHGQPGRLPRALLSSPPIHSESYGTYEHFKIVHVVCRVLWPVLNPLGDGAYAQAPGQRSHGERIRPSDHMSDAPSASLRGPLAPRTRKTLHRDRSCGRRRSAAKDILLEQAYLRRDFVSYVNSQRKSDELCEHPDIKHFISRNLWPVNSDGVLPACAHAGPRSCATLCTPSLSPASPPTLRTRPRDSYVPRIQLRLGR
ncbi:hypothetical protein PsYK624_011840 [Phanerochaete sordida]|uniref:Uncharacterized protein n=1 Tax=Phanerochaete sordida TaxID=48140 RepID=A0A9P3L8W9_9APHY|nr:hypothetical protein PsYK624_011840 [Phanerochaete sordida]